MTVYGLIPPYKARSLATLAKRTVARARTIHASLGRITGAWLYIVNISRAWLKVADSIAAHRHRIKNAWPIGARFRCIGRFISASGFMVTYSARWFW